MISSYPETSLTKVSSLEEVRGHRPKYYEGKIYMVGSQELRLKHPNPLAFPENNNNSNLHYSKNQNKMYRGARSKNEQTDLASTTCYTSQVDLVCLPYYESLYRPLILTNMLKMQESFLRHQESLLRPHPASISHRNTVVNWVILIHTKYRFQPETLHEAVMMFNRYVSRKPYLNSVHYEQIALTCLWMAAKMEQRKIKTLKAWLVFGKGYTSQEIIETQSDVLNTLDFQLCVPTAFAFMQTLSTYYELSERTLCLATYILELTLLNCNYLRFEQHVLSLGVFYLAFKILNLSEWNQKIVDLMNVDIAQVRECASLLCRDIQKIHENSLSSVYRKYSSREYNQVARIKFGRRSYSTSDA